MHYQQYHDINQKPYVINHVAIKHCVQFFVHVHGILSIHERIHLLSLVLKHELVHQDTIVRTDHAFNSLLYDTINITRWPKILI